MQLFTGVCNQCLVATLWMGSELAGRLPAIWPPWTRPMGPALEEQAKSMSGATCFNNFRGLGF